MLKDTYVPIELPSIGASIDPEEIERIREEALIPLVCRRPRGFRLLLKSQDLEVFAADMRAQEPTMEVTNFSMGCKELCGHGLGTKILGEAVEFGKRLNPDLNKITTSWEHISNLNTFAKVLGPENVSARAGNENYGNGYDKPLEEIIRPGITRVQWIEATIDPTNIKL